MFGILFALLFLVTGSIAAAGLAALVFRRRSNSLAITFSVLICPSILVALWLTGCYTVQQVKSATGHKLFWFFEAVCPLTGGYDLSFDTKFRTGSIAKHGKSTDGATVWGISALQVTGPVISGQYDDLEQGRFFLFDSRTGTLRTFESRADIEAALGHPIDLRMIDDVYEAAR
jgi:hypothetical protein